MDTPEPKKPGSKFLGMVVPLLLAIGLFVGLVKLFGYATRRTSNPVSQNMAVCLANGIQNFRSDYKRWPVDAGERHQSDATILVNLLGRDLRVNRRGRNFLDCLPMPRVRSAVVAFYKQKITPNSLIPGGTTL